MKGTARKIPELERVLAAGGRTLILTHDNPDPDAIAAGLGFQHLLKQAFGLESTLAYGGIVGRAENQAMLEHLRITLTAVEGIAWGEFSRVALIDTQPLTGNNSLPADIRADVIIDHHPVRPETRGAAYVDVRENVGASSSLVTDYLREVGVEIPSRLATALYYGIKSDTQDLGRDSSPLDLESYLFLFPKVRRRLLNRILNPKVSGDYFKVLNRAFNKARMHAPCWSRGWGGSGIRTWWRRWRTCSCDMKAWSGSLPRHGSGGR